MKKTAVVEQRKLNHVKYPVKYLFEPQLCCGPPLSPKPVRNILRLQGGPDPACFSILVLQSKKKAAGRGDRITEAPGDPKDEVSVCQWVGFALDSNDPPIGRDLGWRIYQAALHHYSLLPSLHRETMWGLENVWDGLTVPLAASSSSLVAGKKRHLIRNLQKGLEGD